MISLEDEVIERAEASLRMRLSNSSGPVSDYGGWINTTFACMSQKSIEISVKHKAIRINGVPTRVSSVVPDKADNDVAIVVIPGNPGSIGFYDIFISTLFQASGGKFAIYGVSHAGHSRVDVDEESFWEDEEWYKSSPTSFNLEDQIIHKLSFITHHLPQYSKLILIGHSVGSYIILQMLKRYHDKERILKAYLLFPTIERISSSRSGNVWAFISFILFWPFVISTWVFSFLPSSVQKYSIGWFMWLKHNVRHPTTIDATHAFLTYTSVSNILQTGRDLFYVDSLDYNCVEENLNKLVFYYGACDPWVPVSFYEDMKSRFPGGNIKFCQHNIKHAFVLDASEHVAQMVWVWIRDELLGTLSS